MEKIDWVGFEGFHSSYFFNLLFLIFHSSIFQIWSLAISPNGRFLISSGHDKTLRLWEKTHEPLVLEDERETEREKESDDQLATGDSRVVPGEQVWK